MALKVAKLDPSASTFQIQPDESTTSTTPPSPSPIARFISKLLPWNSTRIIGSQTSNSAFNIAAQSQPQSTTSATTSTNLSFASKAVRQAENAVILHEVISTPLQSQSSEEKRRFRYLEVLKRFCETLLAIALASIYAADWISTETEEDQNWKLNWVLLWVSGPQRIQVGRGRGD